MEDSCCKQRKRKILCLHGFRTSGSFLKSLIGKWDPSIFEHCDMIFPDGFFPASGKSGLEGVFPPPYFEWFRFNEDFSKHENLDVCVSLLCDYVTANGPFDGLLGFSQGAALSALVIGYQTQGKILKDHPPMKLFVSISGGMFTDADIREAAFKDRFQMKSVHFVGAEDYLRKHSEELAAAFEDPLIIRHPQGHRVPRLEEADAARMREYVSSIFESDELGGGGGGNVGSPSKNVAVKVDEIVGEVDKLQLNSVIAPTETCV